jgi:hypothetical protein
MTVTLDSGDKVEAWISDEYAESATPKAVKEAVIKFNEEQSGKQKEMDALIAQAAKLGLVLVQPDQEPARTPAPKSAPKPAPAVINEDFVPENPNNRVVDGRVADSRKVNANVSGSASYMGQGVSGGGAEYAIGSSDKPTEDLKEGEKAEIGMVKGRAGMQIAIPVRRSGKTGETKIAVVETGGDAALQRRFKDLAKQSETDAPDFGHGGYQVKTVNCGVCRGTGRVMGKKSCPKCGGAGAYDIDA